MKAPVLVLMIAFAALPLTAAAQLAPAPRAPAGPMTVERISSPFVINPEYKITDIDGGIGHIVGASIGRLVDNVLFVGGGGYWLADSSRGTDMWYGGAIVGWRMWADKPVALTVQGLAGLGHATLNDKFDDGVRFPIHIDSGPGRHFDLRGGHVGFSQAFVVFEPQADLTVNALNRVSLRAGIGYRLTASEWDTLSSINGVTGTFGAQIGW